VGRCWWYFQVAGISKGEEPRSISGDRLRALASADGQFPTTILGITYRRGSASENMVYTVKIERADKLGSLGGVQFPEAMRAKSFARCRSLADRKSFEICKSAMARSSFVCNTADRALLKPRIGFPKQMLLRTAYGSSPGKHAWETAAVGGCVGLTEWLIAGRSARRRAAQHSRINIVPIVDLDTVSAGAGGRKEKLAGSHRDWIAAPLYHPDDRGAAAGKLPNKTTWPARHVIISTIPDWCKSSFFPYHQQLLVCHEGWANVARFSTRRIWKSSARCPVRAPMSRIRPGYYDARWQQIGKNWVTMHSARHVVSIHARRPRVTRRTELPMDPPTTGQELGQTMNTLFSRRPEEATTE